jgi:ribosomal protein S27AE
MARGGWRYGAGRPGWRAVAETTLRLDLRQLRHHPPGCGAFPWAWTYSDGTSAGSIVIDSRTAGMELRYTANGRPVQDWVPYARTEPHFGGSRLWLRCPRCAGRVIVLYLLGERFVCRRCGSVRYASQGEDVIGRAMRRQDKLSRRLGEDGSRPRGMHERTYARLIEGIRQADVDGVEGLTEMMVRLGMAP